MITKLIQGRDQKTQLDRAFIVWVGAHKTESYEVGEYITLGRDSECNVCIESPFASSRHARIRHKNGRYFIEDLKSKNGTFINGTQIVEAGLNDKDRVSIADKEFLFSLTSESKSDQLKLTSKNETWNQQLSRLLTMAESDFSILITGPSGSGKEILADMIHRYSKRCLGPFVSVNCSALSESLVESELFGHIKGSFTGSENNRKGAFESARGGTLFLDEIGDLPISLQPKLLRALENHEVKPVGSDQSIRTDVRVVAATHSTLKEKVQKGLFREDLYFRLNVLSISPPPLIQRMEDFETLLYYFAKEYRVSFSFQAIQKLKEHHWPGNIRELKNLVARASASFSHKSITENQIDELIDKNYFAPMAVDQMVNNQMTLREVEKELICKQLQKNRGNQRKTAEILGMAKSTLNDKIKAFGIRLDDF